VSGFLIKLPILQEMNPLQAYDSIWALLGLKFFEYRRMVALLILDLLCYRIDAEHFENILGDVTLKFDPLNNVILFSFRNNERREVTSQKSAIGIRRRFPFLITSLKLNNTLILLIEGSMHFEAEEENHTLLRFSVHHLLHTKIESSLPFVLLKTNKNLNISNLNEQLYLLTFHKRFVSTFCSLICGLSFLGCEAS
jgi:hypothetical protein